MCRGIEMKVHRIVTGTSLVIMTENQSVKTFFSKKTAVFAFSKHTQDLLQVAVSCTTRGKGLRGLQPPLAESLRKYNPKAKRLNALELILRIKGSRQFNSFSDF